MDSIPGIWFPKIYQVTKQQKRLSEIPILETINSSGFHNNYASQSYPFILKNCFKVLSKQEVIEVLINNCGNHKINVRFGDMSNPTDYLNRRSADMELNNFIHNHFLQPNTLEIAYAGSSAVDDNFLTHLNISYPNFYPDSFFNQPRLWMGKAGTVTPLHKDIPDNFAFNYFGIKKWIVYPPRDYPNLYMTNPTPDEFPDFGASQINLKNIDDIKFPNFKETQGIEFTLQQADLLYLPAGWSHYVENIEDTLMLNFWLKREKSPAVLGNDK